jgi:hypothetical protein
MEKFLVNRDDSIYQAWPDVALCAAGRLVCVWSECTHHGDRSYTRIVVAHSDDRGRTWTSKRPVSEPITKQSVEDSHWNCPRITLLTDGRLVILVDRLTKHAVRQEQSNWLFWSSDEGETWDGPHPSPAQGVVPDKLLELKQGPHAGRWILSAHDSFSQYLRQQCWVSDDRGKSWNGPHVIAARDGLNLCEGSILELPSGELVCFLRENSFLGLDAFKAISHDGGTTWEEVHAFASPGCHRPVTGILHDGKVLITHRYLPGGKGGWGNATQNTFATLTDIDSCLALDRRDQVTRVMPIDYDRNPYADTGYTGWVQFQDDEIYVVNYILDDSPKAQVRGYSLRAEDFLLPI